MEAAASTTSDALPTWRGLAVARDLSEVGGNMVLLFLLTHRARAAVYSGDDRDGHINGNWRKQ